MDERSVNQKDCLCGCGKILSEQYLMEKYGKEVAMLVKKQNRAGFGTANCSECGITLQDRERCIYKKRVLCQPCIRKMKRRGA